MIQKNMIHEQSPLNNEDFLEIIKNFKQTGVTIDDRGRNLIKTFEVKGLNVNVKSFKIPHVINKFAYKYLRKSKAQRSFEYASILKEKGILTPAPLAYYEYYNDIGLINSYYFSEHINYDLTYRELREFPKYPDYENILRQFTRFTYTLHENGIFFKDHSAGNTLIIKKDDHYDFYLIDLNRMRFMTLNLDDRMKNFAKLTEIPDMIEIMSDEYSKLINVDYEVILEKMWNEINKFRKKYQARAQLKAKFQDKNKSQ